MQDSTNQRTKTEEVSLSKRKRWLVFFCFCFLNSCLMIGSGITSSAIVFIKESFQVTDKEFGLLGTAFNSGSFVGSLLFISFANKFNRKFMLLSSLSIHCLAVLTCSLTSKFSVFLACRAISGSGVMMWFIYNMVWIDQFGMQKSKSWMVTLISLSGQLSMLWGYVINLVAGPVKWKQGFRIEFLVITLILIMLLCIPKIYFSHNLLFKTRSEKEIIEKSNERLNSVFAYNQVSILTEKSEETKDASPIKDNNHSNNNKTKPSLFTPMFIIVTLAKAAQLYVMVTLMFWFTDYIHSALKVTNQTHIFYCYISANIIANLIGMVLSGVVSSAIGGYGSKNTLLACFALKMIAFPFGAMIPFTNSFVLFSILLFCYNLCDSLAFLLSNSLIMAYVPKEMKGTANGVFSIAVNFLAFLPSSYVYGYLKQIFANVNPKLPFGIMMYYGFTSNIYMFIGLITQKKTQLAKNQFENQSDTEIPEREDNENKEVFLQEVIVVNK